MHVKIISVIIGLALIIGAFIVIKGGNTDSSDIAVDNVSVVNGKQIIEINAKGGYQPRKSIAQAGVPTIIRFKTKGTFDCSSAIRISSLGISKQLPPSGVTDIDIGSGQLGTLKGSCGMGMYPFEIEFQS